MAQQDYILRMIEQLGRMLVAMRDAVLGRDSDAATIQERLASAGRENGVDVMLARSFTPETLVMMVSMGGEVEPGRAWLLAELLYLDGLDAYLRADGERAHASLLRALVLYRLIGPGFPRLPDFPEIHERIAEVEGMLDDPFPPAA